MEDENNNAVTQTEQNTEGAVTATVEKTERTFTQEEVNAMLTKERKKMPDKEELKKFKEWQENQKTESEKLAEKEKEYQNTLAKNTELENTISILKAGVKQDDLDYVLFKVNKMEGEDFDKNLSKFLKQNPKYLTNTEPKIIKKVGSSLSLSGKETSNQNETNQIMNDLIRSSRD